MDNSLYPFYKRKRFTSVGKYIQYNFEYYKNNIFCEYIKDDKIIKITFKEALKSIKKLSNYFNGTQQKIGLLGQMSFEWLISYLSILYSGNIAVPLDVHLSSEDIKKRLLHVNLDFLLTEYPYFERIDSKKLPSLEILLFNNSNKSVNTLINNTMLSTNYKLPKISSEDLAEIAYTSGTSGFAKGVVLTQKNLISSVTFATMMLNLKADDIVLSVLPNNHLYELTAGILTPMYFGVPIAINGHIKNMRRNLRIFHPTTIVLVPAILQSIKKMISNNVHGKSKKIILDLFINIFKKSTFLSYSFKRTVFKKISKVFGNNLRQVICGGAPLDKELINYFDAIGINTIEGYGITECGPIISSNTDRYKIIGSVGKINPFCSVKIEADGEILVSGDIVMKEYLNDPEKTRLSFNGQWFKTGDLGEIDRKGYLYVKGRKKNLIILSNGENIVPEELELKISRIPFVEEVIVKNINEKITAIIYTKYKNSQTIIEDAIKDMNKKMQINKRIQKIMFKEKPFKKNTSHKIIR